MGLRGPTAKATAPKTIQFKRGAPPPPDWLDSEAKKLYARAIKLFRDSGSPSQLADMDTLASYAQASADCARYEMKIREQGEVITTPQGEIANPLLKFLTAARRERWTAIAKLGFSPADRARVPASSKAEADEFDEFVK